MTPLGRQPPPTISHVARAIVATRYSTPPRRVRSVPCTCAPARASADDLADRAARQRRELHQAQPLVDRAGDEQRQRGTELAHRPLAQLLGVDRADPGGERRIARGRTPFIRHFTGTTQIVRGGFNYKF